MAAAEHELHEIIQAINDCDLERVQELANAGTRYERELFGTYPVCLATKKVEQVEILRFLLGGDRVAVMIPDTIISCITNGNLEAMKVTFEIAKKHGIDVNCHIPYYPCICCSLYWKDCKFTPLITCIMMNGSYEMIEWLLLNGADVNVQYIFQNEPVGIVDLAKKYREPHDQEIVDLLEGWLLGGATIKSAK